MVLNVALIHAFVVLADPWLMRTRLGGYLVLSTTPAGYKSTAHPKNMSTVLYKTENPNARPVCPSAGCQGGAAARSLPDVLVGGLG